MIQNFREDYNHPFPIVRFYFRRVLSTAVAKLNSLPKNSLILDFGCGRQYLKKYLRDSKLRIVGYDIVSEFTDVQDYTSLKPDAIFCNHVLEHLNIAELRKTLDNFKKMKPKFIIIGIPTENFISRLCAAIGKPHGYFEHKTKINTIHDELHSRFNLLDRKNIMTLTIISKWEG